MAEACRENVAGPCSASSHIGDNDEHDRNFTIGDILLKNAVDNTPQTGPIFCRGAIRDGQTIILFLNKRLRGYLQMGGITCQYANGVMEELDPLGKPYAVRLLSYIQSRFR
jgi:hypothetical protein